MFLDKLPTLSHRNKQAKMNDFLTSTLESLEGRLNMEQKSEMEKKNENFLKKVDEFCKELRKGIEENDFKLIFKRNEKGLKLMNGDEKSHYDYADSLKINVIEDMKKQLKSNFQNQTFFNNEKKLEENPKTTTESNQKYYQYLYDKFY
jgi:hypothetical protein